ncbi:Uncharacterised protein r2_g1865 [Pycnogonum litorale]
MKTYTLKLNIKKWNENLQYASKVVTSLMTFIFFWKRTKMSAISQLALISILKDEPTLVSRNEYPYNCNCVFYDSSLLIQIEKSCENVSIAGVVKTRFALHIFTS